MNLGTFTSLEKRSRSVRDRQTRYKFKNHFSDGTFTFLPSKRLFELPETTRDLYHEVSAGEFGKLDTIAQKYYGNVRYWWIIAQANQIMNPLRLEPGTYLRIPPIEVVYEVLK